MTKKRNTVRKKMTLRDYVTFLNYLETGERTIDLSKYNEACLDSFSIRVMSLTEEQKKELPNFITDTWKKKRVKEILKNIPLVGEDIPPELIEPVQIQPVIPKKPKKDKYSAKVGWVNPNVQGLCKEKIDIKKMAEAIENGLSVDKCLDIIYDLAGSQQMASKFLSIPLSSYGNLDLPDNYSGCFEVTNVITEAEDCRVRAIG